jgi:methyl-accepting chemotaxis protein
MEDKRMRPFKNISVRFKIMVPVVLLTVILVVSSLAGFNGLGRLMAASTEISDHYTKSMYLAGAIDASFKDLQAIGYAHIVARTEEDKADGESYMTETYSEIQSLMSTYEEMLEPGSEEESYYNAYKTEYDNFTTVYTEMVTLSRNGEDAAAIAMANGEIKEVIDATDATLNDLQTYAYNAMENAKAYNSTVYSSVLRMCIILLIVGIIIAILSVFTCHVEVISPIARINKKLKQIVNEINNGQGDLTKRVKVTGKDELGQLSDSANVFIATLQGIMGKITENAISLDSIVHQVTKSVSDVNGSSCDISAAMEELSASMEEVSATAANVNENTNSVGDSVNEIADASDELVTYANEMERRASELENTAIANKNNTSEVIENIIANLKKAMEDSKSVDRVNELTNDILSISSQTNLLALNASIEAARAGEAGKGFAVVADEIRQLADSSRQTASNIQNINNMVTDAVKELVKCSDDIVNYINDNILPDYDAFVESGKQYREDAVHVNGIVTDFGTRSSELKKVVSEITDAISGITLSIDESTNAITTSAVNTNELVEGISQISGQMETNNEIAIQLKGEADRFANL